MPLALGGPKGFSKRRLSIPTLQLRLAPSAELTHPGPGEGVPTVRFGQCVFAALIALAGASCAGPAMQTRSAVELPTQMPDVGADEIATEKRRQQVFALQSFSQQNGRYDTFAHCSRAV